MTIEKVRLRITPADGASEVTLGLDDGKGGVISGPVQMSPDMMLNMARTLARQAEIAMRRLEMEASLAEARETPSGILIPRGVTH